MKADYLLLEQYLLDLRKIKSQYLKDSRKKTVDNEINWNVWYSL